MSNNSSPKSKVPYSTFGNDLAQQEAQLAQDVLVRRFRESRASCQPTATDPDIILSARSAF